MHNKSVTDAYKNWLLILVYCTTPVTTILFHMCVCVCSSHTYIKQTDSACNGFHDATSTIWNSLPKTVLESPSIAFSNLGSKLFCLSWPFPTNSTTASSSQAMTLWRVGSYTHMKRRMYVNCLSLYPPASPTGKWRE